MTNTTPPEYLLILKCPDKRGIVTAVAGTLADLDCNIEESSQFGDPDTGHFFMRLHFSAPANTDLEKMRERFRPLARRYSMWWEMRPQSQKTRVMIMVSKQDHCLADLLYRWRIGSLPLEITRVVSNHETCRQIVEREGLTYNCLPISKSSKARQEKAVREIIEKDQVDLVILARYMQILSNRFANDYLGRIINIHHSFLPSFKGARPYHQAHARGVKIIGATAHYVTPDLDEGPIIEQETERVSHNMSANELVVAGREIERRVLARAVKYHIEQRVLINESKTVIFH
ncbi:MAG: formyltetrahydrofolate deformylase [Hyphomicrobiaceae bacterium]|nr:formyltetrahydrofolate deformylase [Hyphomicrobiaceae bacterium]